MERKDRPSPYIHKGGKQPENSIFPCSRNYDRMEETKQ